MKKEVKKAEERLGKRFYSYREAKRKWK